MLLSNESYGNHFSITICNKTQDYLWDILTSSEGGWENNDGGRGEITWNVNDDKISVNHVQYTTTEVSREHEF